MQASFLKFIGIASTFRSLTTCSRSILLQSRARRFQHLSPLNMAESFLHEDRLGSSSFCACSKCRGEGRRSKPVSKRARLRYKREKVEAGNSYNSSAAPPPPPRRWESCAACAGTGLVVGKHPQTSMTNKKVAIAGGGIGGLALAVALQHRGIPFVVFERDTNFSERRQGYGLTMQQASKALKSFGIFNLADGISSTKHIVHTHHGDEVGSWGLRKWGRSSSKDAKRQNVHIARQSLRRNLLNALGGDAYVQWGCQLSSFTEHDDHVELTFQQGSDTVITKADLLVGADGIRSTVRSKYIGENATPLRYLGCIVVLGICPRNEIASSSPLLDGETVFQTADGSTRLYVMPYSPTEYMWQLSYPVEEEQARMISGRGARILKQEALRLCGEWHDPVPQLLTATPETLVSGYPVYDRTILSSSFLPSSRVTLLGDAAHPMSPFKGQGANQALLDALSLARTLYKTSDIKVALPLYQEEMLARSAVKVQASADAARFLHTDVATQKGNVTRGAAAKTAKLERRNASSEDCDG